MSKAHVDVWQGRPAYVVGTANGGDMGSQQFWVDADRLLLVRLITEDSSQPGTLVDIHFLNYRSLPHGLIATKIEAYRNRRLAMQEEYSDIKIDVPLDPAVFDTTRLAVARH
jgi:outer membrane lipoprotein-sorting protein